MKSKKMILAVFLGLLASAAALISALFMLQQLKSVSALPKEVDNLRKSIEAISVDVDVSPLNKRIDDVVKHVNELGSTVESMRANELATIQPNNQSNIQQPNIQQPNTQQPNNQTNIQPNNPVTPSTPITPPNKPVEPNKPIKNKEVEKPKEQQKPKEHKTTQTTNRLNLRSKPGLKTPVVKVTSNGEKLTIVGEPVEKDGYKWIEVKDSKGNTGWVVQKYTH
ncbi:MULTISPECIES: SH3 domain-containing protein [Bacillus cereus group]|uniref:SH3b domain-containing protein n=1 Tax=Bacillus thuringiensis TaxID=1428 RepID=A0A9X6WHT2_BACTU|nr:MULTISPECIES: SH3 domain-containing protein [Bacillus cereus group]MDA1674631.1 SH3 domain-containing protein [Bacillus cereus group sp. TH152-1LC]PFJ29379.1 hypothetical protein COJ15_31820 [Bacillus thuringiensis]PGP12567.1 hypothetical protein COA01_32645 [Bacillus cereus]